MEDIINGLYWTRRENTGTVKSNGEATQMGPMTPPWVNILPKNPYLAKRWFLKNLILLMSKNDDFCQIVGKRCQMLK